MERDALAHLTQVFNALMPAVAGTDPPLEVAVDPLEMAAAGVGGIVGLARDPPGEIRARRVRAVARVLVSLHCPLTRETHHLIDARALARMKRSAVLVNTARGAIVDEAALVAALRSGAIAAAGLDVYEDEPRLAPGLAELPNAVLLPHIGSATHAARDAMGMLCAEAVIAELSGRAAPNRLV